MAFGRRQRALVFSALAWRYILDQHIYAGDAVQVVMCVRERCDFLVAADQRLLEVCRQLGVECFNPELAEDQQKIRERLIR